jgi:hypothetical protein
MVAVVRNNASAAGSEKESTADSALFEEAASFKSIDFMGAHALIMKSDPINGTAKNFTKTLPKEEKSKCWTMSLKRDKGRKPSRYGHFKHYQFRMILKYPEK